MAKKRDTMPGATYWASRNFFRDGAKGRYLSNLPMEPTDIEVRIVPVALVELRRKKGKVKK